MIQKDLIKWICTEGGPLICIPESCVGKWGGSLTRSLSENTELNTLPKDFMNPSVTHYGEVCEKDDLIVNISIDDIPAIIFGDLPSNTSWIPITNRKSLFIRWIYADKEDSIKAIREHLTELEWQEEFEIEIKENHWYLFDSAAIFKQLNEREFQRVIFEKGVYDVFSSEYSLQEKESFDVYKFAKR
ncbi:MAG: Imm21 family immunity protein [Bacteroidota bacterium]